MFKWVNSIFSKGVKEPLKVDLYVSLRDYTKRGRKGRPNKFPEEGTKFYSFRSSGNKPWMLIEKSFRLKTTHIALYKLGNFFLTKEEAIANKAEVMRVFNSSKLVK